MAQGPPTRGLGSELVPGLGTSPPKGAAQGKAGVFHEGRVAGMQRQLLWPRSPSTSWSPGLADAVRGESASPPTPGRTQVSRESAVRTATFPEGGATLCLTPPWLAGAFAGVLRLGSRDPCCAEVHRAE